MSQKPNKTMFSLPLSHSDLSYLVCLIGTDIARLKGTPEGKVMLIPAYRLLAKTKAMRGGEATKEKEGK